MSFEKDYSELIKYAERGIQQLEVSIFPEDLINQAYINLHTQPYSLIKFKEEIKSLAQQEKRGVFNKGQNVKQDYKSNIEAYDYLKQRTLKAFKKFVNKDRAKWNEYLRMRDKHDRETLADAYIRKILRPKYGTAYLLEHPEIVEQKRKKIFAKRLAKSLK